MDTNITPAAYWTTDFYVNGRIITVDKNTLPPDGIVGDNTGFFAHFIFSEEWTETTKTARFILNGKHTDVIFSGDTVEFPLEVMKSGLIAVGVFAGSQKATTAEKFLLRPSVLNENGPPADPTPDVYTQVMEKLNSLGEAASISIVNWTAEDTEGSGS